MTIHGNTILLPIYVETDRFVVLALAYMVLNVNIKCFFVENYIIQVELYIGIYALVPSRPIDSYIIVVSPMIKTCDKSNSSVEGFSGNTSPGGIFEEKSTTSFFNLIWSMLNPFPDVAVLGNSI